MDGYGPATYGDIWAEDYDAIYPAPGADQVEFLVQRAGE